MSETFRIVCPDGVQPDEYLDQVRRTFKNVQGTMDQVELPIQYADTSAVRPGLAKPKHLVMTSVKRTSEDGHDLLVINGFGFVEYVGEKFDPMTCCKGIDCYIDRRTYSITVEARKFRN